MMWGRGVVVADREKRDNAQGIQQTLAALEHSTTRFEIERLIEQLKGLYLTRASWASYH
jgi:hypothetical protein